MLFWQVVLTMSALGAVFVLWPIFKLPFKYITSTNPIRRDVTQAELYEEHLADLDRSLARKDIDSEQYHALKIELQRTLVLESDGLVEVKTRGGGKLLLMAAALLVPVLAIFFYSQLWGAKDDWDIYSYLENERVNPPQTQEELEQSSRQLLLDVQARLKQNPNNHQLRYLLAERSFAIRDYDGAIAAYKYILNAEPGSPSIAIKLAQSLFVRSGNKVTPEIAHYTDIAVKGAPFMYSALEMSGLVAFSNGDFRNAILFWQRAKEQLDPNSRSAQALDGAINKAASAAVAAGVDTSASASAEAKVADAGSADISRGFDVSVSLAESVNAAKTDTVFVYARAVGGKMPLAISRITVADLPKVVRLDNTMAMAPGMDMSSASQLEIIARVSKSGSPVPQPGDWQAMSEAVVLGDGVGTQTLVISVQVP